MKKESQFLSGDGRTMIHYTMWYPEDMVKGVVQLTHGMTEYMKNYNEFAEFLAKNNFFVIGHDQLGHGRSVLDNTELGYFIKKDSVDILINDMKVLMNKGKSQYPEVPYFLLGHSFGSFLSRIYGGLFGKELNGIILTGTGNSELKKVKTALSMVKALSIIMNGKHRSKFILSRIFGPYLSRIKEPKNMHEWFSRDEMSVEDYLNDPLNNYVYTLNGFSTLFLSIIKMEDKTTFEGTPKNLPILMLSGSEDPVGGYSKKVLKVYDIYKEYNMKDIMVKIYDGARHNVLCEINKDEVMNDILKWLNEKINFKLI